MPLTMNAMVDPVRPMLKCGDVKKCGDVAGRAPVGAGFFFA